MVLVTEGERLLNKDQRPFALGIKSAMDSESEDADDQSKFLWHTSGRDVMPVSRTEEISGDTMDSMRDTKDQKNEAGEESLKGVISIDSNHKTSSRSIDPVSTSLNSVETLSESGQSGAVSSLPVSRMLICNSSTLDESRINYAVVSDDKEEKEKKCFLPPVNVAEKIILCFDLSEDQFYLTSKFNEVNSISTLNVIKQAIELFIHSKHMIDKRHEFALVVVHQKAVWLQDFTNKPKDILPVLSELTETPPSSSFCLTSLFDVLKENVTLPLVEDATIPPPYIIRPILIYSRCQCIPKFSDGKESFHALMSSKYFSVDYIVIHESLSTESHTSDEIAKTFSEMSTKPYSLKFHISRSATNLLDSMAKLVSHPLQRCTSYDLKKELGDKHAIFDSNGHQ